MAVRPGRGGTPSFDKAEAAYWLGLKVGDFVNLSDFQSLADGGSSGLDGRVADIRDLAVADSGTGQALVRYRLHDLDLSGGRRLFFLVLAAGEAFELRSYTLFPGLGPATRDQLIDRGETWLFLPPPDPEDFLSKDLELAPFPDVPAVAEGGISRKRVWERSGFGQTLYGSYRRGPDEVAVLLAEYETREAGATSPLLLVVEEGWLDSRGRALESGGLVSVLLGGPLDPGSVDLFPA